VLFYRTPTGCHGFLAPVPGAKSISLFRSGGLRYAATTGYYLTAFQAEISSKFRKWSIDITIGVRQLAILSPPYAWWY